MLRTSELPNPDQFQYRPRFEILLRRKQVPGSAPPCAPRNRLWLVYTQGVHRRRFIAAASASLLVPHQVLAALARRVEPKPHFLEYAFHDERFAQAEQLCSRLAPGAVQVAVAGDVTGAWNGWLQSVSAQAPLRLHGVTTESFHFCLVNLLRTTTQLETGIARLDRDLHRWHIHTSHDRFGVTGI